MVLLAIDEKNPAVVAIRLKHVETLQLSWDICWGAFFTQQTVGIRMTLLYISVLPKMVVPPKMDGL